MSETTPVAMNPFRNADWVAEADPEVGPEEAGRFGVFGRFGEEDPETDPDVQGRFAKIAQDDEAPPEEGPDDVQGRFATIAQDDEAPPEEGPDDVQGRFATIAQDDEAPPEEDPSVESMASRADSALAALRGTQGREVDPVRFEADVDLPDARPLELADFGADGNGLDGFADLDSPSFDDRSLFLAEEEGPDPEPETEDFSDFG